MGDRHARECAARDVIEVTVNEVDIDTTLIGYVTNRISRRAFARTSLFGSAGLAALGAMTSDVKADAEF